MDVELVSIGDELLLRIAQRLRARLRAEDTLALVSAINRPGLKLNLDLYHAQIGEGNLNWPAILSAAAESGVRWYLVEQDDCYGESCFDVLATSYRHLRAMGLE